MVCLNIITTGYIVIRPVSSIFTSWPRVRSRLVLRLLCGFRVCWYVYLCVHTYHVRNNYVTYIVAMRPYFSRLRQFRRLLCVAAMSSLPQLLDTEKQRQCRHDDARLTKSGNARSEQLNTCGAYRVANQQSWAC